MLSVNTTKYAPGIDSWILDVSIFIGKNREKEL